MYTVEMDHDEIEIIVLDDAGFNDDLKVLLYDDICFIHQFDQDNGIENIIQISPEMWDELVSAINSPEGAFRIVTKETKK